MTMVMIVMVKTIAIMCWLYLEKTSFPLMLTARCLIFSKFGMESTGLNLSTVFIGNSLEKVWSWEVDPLNRNYIDHPNEDTDFLKHWSFTLFSESQGILIIYCCITMVLNNFFPQLQEFRSSLVGWLWFGVSCELQSKWWLMLPSSESYSGTVGSAAKLVHAHTWQLVLTVGRKPQVLPMRASPGAPWVSSHTPIGSHHKEQDRMAMPVVA